MKILFINYSPKAHSITIINRTTNTVRTDIVGRRRPSVDEVGQRTKADGGRTPSYEVCIR